MGLSSLIGVGFSLVEQGLNSSKLSLFPSLASWVYCKNMQQWGCSSFLVLDFIDIVSYGVEAMVLKTHVTQIEIEGESHKHSLLYQISHESASDVRNFRLISHRLST